MLVQHSSSNSVTVGSSDDGNYPIFRMNLALFRLEKCCTYLHTRTHLKCWEARLLLDGCIDTSQTTALLTSAAPTIMLTNHIHSEWDPLRNRSPSNRHVHFLILIHCEGLHDHKYTSNRSLPRLDSAVCAVYLCWLCWRLGLCYNQSCRDIPFGHSRTRKSGQFGKGSNCLVCWQLLPGI